MKECGAKTRAGTQCKRAGMPNGRCSKHGGKSLHGIASPRFKHGRYSRYPLISMMAVMTALVEYERKLDFRAGKIQEIYEELESHELIQGDDRGNYWVTQEKRERGKL